MKIEHTNSRMTLKGSNSFAAVGVVAFVMGSVGIFLISDMLRSADSSADSSDVLGVVIASVWTLLTFSMGVYALASGSRTLTLDDDGVTCKTWFQQSFLPWNEVNDWGLSYHGRDRWGNNFYDLYFSREMYPVRNECAKKLRGRILRVTIDDYMQAVNSIIPFCRGKTTVVPFVGTDKPHFI